MSTITIKYQTAPEEFAKASFIFIESKRMLNFMIWIVNIAAVSILSLLTLKIFQTGMTIHDAGLSLFLLFWLFGRKKMNQFIFLKKFKKNIFDKQTLNITLSQNGIIWQGEKFAKGEIQWPKIAYIIEVANGLILTLSPTQFLWLPYRALPDTNQKNQLLALIKEKNVKIKKILNYQC